jgi:hypothetical protein
VGAVLKAAAFSGAFVVLLAGAPGISGDLRRAGLDLAGEAVAEVSVAPLDREELRAHLCGWIEATLTRSAPPVIVTPDALLLVELRSGGALERVDCIAENMLVLAAAEGRRVLSSWHAWAASDRERWATRAAALPRRPAGWPPPEVVDVIDACRRAAGVPPWPRAAGARVTTPERDHA